MKKHLLFLLISFSFFSCTQTNSDKDKERIRMACDEFMQFYCDKKIPVAIELLKKNSVMEHSTLDTLQTTMMNHLNSTFAVYGKLKSYEFISEHNVKDFIAKRFYVVKFDKYFLKFDFTLYSSGAGWVITGINYNDELIELLY